MTDLARFWNDLRLRVRALLFGRRVEQELDEELRFHLEMAARKNAALGASGAEAARLARIRFGGLDPVKEECRTVRGTQLAETTLRDIKYALRGFRRSPLFVLTVVGTISIGLGLNTALFTLFDNFVLRPLPVLDPYSLYAFNWTDRAGRGHSFSWREFENFSKNNPAFSKVTAMHDFYARSQGRPLLGSLVTGNYFQMLGGVAALGRTLIPGDSSAPGREPVIVLSYAAWQNKFGADPNIIGRKLVLHGYPLEVIGVARDGFRGLDPAPPDYWAPITMAPQLEGGPGLFGSQDSGLIVGRLKPRVSVSGAEAALTAFARHVTEDRPESERAVNVTLESRATTIRLSKEIILVFSPLGVAVGLVLMLACANVANMMLARAMARQREIGLRLSLGAGRGRLMRQLLTESLLLAIPAGFAGFLVSRTAVESGLRIMYATLPPDIAQMMPPLSLPPDIRVFGFMLAAAFASALLFGLAPAIQSTRADVMLAARGEFTSDVRPMRLRNTLVIVQITVCALLLITSGVLIRGESAMRSSDVGFKMHGVIAMVPPEKARTVILDRLRSNSTVEGLAAASSIPLTTSILPPVLISAGVGAKTSDAWYNYVSPEFFSLLDIPILEGRNFTAEEARSGAPVVIISQLTARRLWPKGDALGREISIRHDARADWGEPLPQYSAARVVGVTRNIISCSIPHGPDPPLVYFPATTGKLALLIRVNGNVEKARLHLDKELSALSLEDIEDIHTMDQFFAFSVYPFRIGSWIGSLLGGLALLLTLSGIYGVLSYLVTQRTKEIGIRMALGASAGAVTRLVMMQSMRLAVVGIGLGTVLALGVSRFLASHLVFVNTFDVLAYGTAVLLVAVASMAAAYVPSRRAARIDPTTTLRYD